jgi:hypothetical protein
VVAASAEAPSSIRTMVDRSAETPPGSVSAPIPGNRQLPGTDRLRAGRSGWTVISLTMVSSPVCSVAMMFPQSSSGTPTGRS